MKLDEWQRIEKVVRWTGLSVNAFAAEIGLPRAENLYQIKKGNHGISKDLAETIAIRYPGISRGWLLTGEGEMKTEDYALRAIIPYYESDARWLATHDKMPQPAYLISLPPPRDNVFAALNLEKAMEPMIPVGATILFEEASADNVIPGLPYLVVLPFDKVVIRIVNKGPSPDKFILTAPNPEFGDMTIDICEVKKIWSVKKYFVTIV